MRNHRRHSLYALILLIAFSVLFNEYLIYYVTVYLGCEWPIIINTKPDETITKIMLIADTHLLGPIRGHWFDKLRREWQMYRAFQTSVQLMKPDAIFFLGDQFDEGQWMNRDGFEQYAKRFESLFEAPKDVKVFVVAGNHDIGFHYEIVPRRVEWFSRSYARELVDYETIANNHFVLINSMAMENDGCGLCNEALSQLMLLRNRFECAKNASKYCEFPLPVPYSPPVIMQHFPLFRESDHHCADEEDAAPEPLKSKDFREKWDCLSAESTELLLKTLKPRAVFAGHTHYGCKTWWPSPYSVWEWTIPSFSWRNTHQPALLLLSITPHQLNVDKCLLPNEINVICLYICVAFIVLLATCFKLFKCCSTNRVRKSYPTYQFVTVKND